MTQDLPSPAQPLRIGTRGSPLALWQAHEVRRCLMAAFALPEAAFEIVVIKVTGDQIQDKALREIGGKGLFTREIEEALLDGGIDIAVHSMKDMPTEQPAGLVLDCYLERADVRDGFVSPHVAQRRSSRRGGGGFVQPAPSGAAGAAAAGPEAGRIPRQRADKDAQARGRGGPCHLPCHGGADAAGHGRVARSAIAPEEMLPAVAQGAIGVERRADDARTAALLAAIHHGETGLRLSAERAFLRRLDGSCETPIAGLAVIEGATLWLRGEILRPDGSAAVAGESRGPVAEGPALGIALAEDLLTRAGPGSSPSDRRQGRALHARRLSARGSPDAREEARQGR